MKGLTEWLTVAAKKLAAPMLAGPLGVVIGAVLGSLGVPQPVVDALLAVVRALSGS